MSNNVLLLAAGAGILGAMALSKDAEPAKPDIILDTIQDPVNATNPAPTPNAKRQPEPNDSCEELRGKAEEMGVGICECLQNPSLSSCDRSGIKEMMKDKETLQGKCELKQFTSVGNLAIDNANCT
tara:strand:+ start:178 stop:555 length:378 start_codon:yes stop_codon:yes gene_type:complete